jgi:hypothetical protein
MRRILGTATALFLLLTALTLWAEPASPPVTGVTWSCVLAGGRPVKLTPDVTAGNYINPSDVLAVTRAGGLPGNRFGMLLAGRDDTRIARIVGMVNRSTGRRPPTDLEVWSTAHGYPVDVVLKLRSGATVYLQRVMDVTVRKLATSMEFTGKTSTDRFMMTIEQKQGDDARHYILYSREVPAYIEQGADADMPRSSTF